MVSIFSVAQDRLPFGLQAIFQLANGLITRWDFARWKCLRFIKIHIHVWICFCVCVCELIEWLMDSKHTFALIFAYKMHFWILLRLKDKHYVCFKQVICFKIQILAYENKLYTHLSVWHTIPFNWFARKVLWNTNTFRPLQTHRFQINSGCLWAWYIQEYFNAINISCFQTCISYVCLCVLVKASPCAWDILYKA